MLLRKLLAEFDPSMDLSAVPDLEILGVRDDSRKVKIGDLFVARGGTKTDSGKFIADAQSRGAIAVVTQSNIDRCALPQILVPDSTAGRPGDKLHPNRAGYLAMAMAADLKLLVR